MKSLLNNTSFKGLLFGLFLMLFTCPAYSAQHHGAYEIDNFQKVSQRQAASMARKRHGGKVLDVKTIRSEGRVVYRVKLLLDSGRVKVVTINGG